MSIDQELDLIGYDPFSQEARTNPHPFYERMRAACRAYRLPQYDAYAIPRFDDVWHLGADRELMSIAEGPVFVEAALRAPAPPLPLPTSRPVNSFSMVDPPTHTVVRKAAFAPFRPSAVAAVEGPLRDDVRAHLARCREAGTFDVVADVAGPAVAASTCRMMGLPVEDHDLISELAHESLRRDASTGGTTPQGAIARQELHQYLTQWVGRARGDAGVVDSLALVDLDSEPLSDEEIAVQVGTLIAGGVETVPKIVAAGVLRLWRHPDQRAIVEANPDLLANACEEIMRLEAPLQWVGRTVTRDAEIAGTHMAAGTRVFLLLASANRDEREFVDPERFDVRRRMARTLAFGHGVHFCIGAAPARLELRVIIDEFLRAIDEYDVLVEGIQRPPSEFQLGYTAMPVRCR